MSYTVNGGSPFVWSKPTSTSPTAQVAVFSAPWVNPSTRAFNGKALVDGAIVTSGAGVGRTKVTPASPVSDNQSYHGGVWGYGGTAKAVSDDRFITVASNLTWAWVYQAGSIAVYPSKSRIIAMRLSS